MRLLKHITTTNKHIYTMKKEHQRKANQNQAYIKNKPLLTRSNINSRNKKVRANPTIWTLKPTKKIKKVFISQRKNLKKVEINDPSKKRWELYTDINISYWLVTSSHPKSHQYSDKLLPPSIVKYLKRYTFDLCFSEIKIKQTSQSQPFFLSYFSFATTVQLIDPIPVWTRVKTKT